jgi:hypothetical protein
MAAWARGAICLKEALGRQLGGPAATAATSPSSSPKIGHIPGLRDLTLDLQPRTSTMNKAPADLWDAAPSSSTSVDGQEVREQVAPTARAPADPATVSMGAETAHSRGKRAAEGLLSGPHGEKRAHIVQVEEKGAAAERGSTAGGAGLSTAAAAAAAATAAAPPAATTAPVRSKTAAAALPVGPFAVYRLVRILAARVAFQPSKVHDTQNL